MKKNNKPMPIDDNYEIIQTFILKIGLVRTRLPILDVRTRPTYNSNLFVSNLFS